MRPRTVLLAALVLFLAGTTGFVWALTHSATLPGPDGSRDPVAGARTPKGDRSKPPKTSEVAGSARSALVATPAAEPRKPAPAAGSKPLDERTESMLERVSRATKLDLGLLQDLAAKYPQFPKQLEELFLAYYPSMSAVQERLWKRTHDIAMARIAAGQYEDFPQDVKVPSGMLGEYVHTGIYYDKVTARDVRRVVRINPGDDLEVDKLQLDLRSLNEGAQKAMKDFLSQFER